MSSFSVSRYRISWCRGLVFAFRNCTISLRPPLAWNVSIRAGVCRSSVSVMLTPLLRNDSSRSLDAIVA